jgi:hypothetical protein
LHFRGSIYETTTSKTIVSINIMKIIRVFQ